MENPVDPLVPPPRRRRRQVALLALLLVGVYALLAALADVGALTRALARLRPVALALAAMLVVAVFAVRSLRWRLYLGHLGVLRPTGPIGFGVAFAMGLPQGKWGQVAKAWAIRRRAGTPYERALPTIFAERISDVLGGLLHVVVGLALVANADMRAVGVAFLVIAGTVVAMRSRALARWAVRALGLVPWVRRHSAAIVEGHERLRGHITVRELAAPSVMALAAFLLESLALWAIAVPGLGLDLGIAECILILALVDVAATLSFLPGGIGAAEGSMLLLLSLEGVPLPEAAAVTIAFRAVALWFGIALGILGVAALRMVPARRGAAAAG